MTRDQLRPLEGQTVIIQGRISSHCRRGDFIDVSYEDCLVRPYRTDVPQLSVEPVEVDHLWEIAPGRVGKVGSETIAIGKVYWYCRSDGSLDLSIKREKSLCLSVVLDMIKQGAGAPDAERLSLLRTARHNVREGAKAGRLLLQSDEMSVDDMLAMLDRCIDRLDRNVRAALRASAGDFVRYTRVQAKRANHRGAAHSFAAMAGGAA